MPDGRAWSFSRPEVMKNPQVIVSGMSVRFGESAGPKMSWECESVCDHFERAHSFSILGDRASHAKPKRWAYLSALNSLRAVFEITLTALKECTLKGDLKTFDCEAKQKVRYFKMVENIRIQDFHRRALLLQPGRMDSVGTVKAQLGNSPTAGVAFLNDGTGPKKAEHKSGRLQQVRPVDWNEFGIFCDEENQYIFIGDLVRAHFDSLLAFIRPYYPDWPREESPQPPDQAAKPSSH
jgi:hypothetical protein